MRGVDRFQLPRARELRRNLTLAEARLWGQLRAKWVDGFKFIRQGPVGPYFADFLCRSKLLIIEVDSATHSTEEEKRRDHARTLFLKEQNYRIFRVTNDEVMIGMDEVLTLIRDELGRES
jgi:very-short-patch-repair endonuclease